MMKPGVLFLVRWDMNGMIQVVNNMKGTAHHLKAWNEAHNTPWIAHALFPCCNSCRGRMIPLHQNSSPMMFMKRTNIYNGIFMMEPGGLISGGVKLSTSKTWAAIIVETIDNAAIATIPPNVHLTPARSKPCRRKRFLIEDHLIGFPSEMYAAMATINRKLNPTNIWQ